MTPQQLREQSTSNVTRPEVENSGSQIWHCPGTAPDQFRTPKAGWKENAIVVTIPYPEAGSTFSVISVSRRAPSPGDLVAEIGAAFVVGTRIGRFTRTQSLRTTHCASRYSVFHPQVEGSLTVG